MKREKIYEFVIDRPLTPAKRKTVEKHLKENAHLSPKPVSYSWDEDDDELLRIRAEPVLIEVKFQDRMVELYATAPLWARLLFTKQKKAELGERLQLMLQKAKFVVAAKSVPPGAKAVAAKKPKLRKARAGAIRNADPPKTKAVSVRKPKLRKKTQSA
jgi:hypothetical protein